MSQTLDKFQGWAAYDHESNVFKPFEYTPKPLGPQDVDIEIECCGMCGSDIHTVSGGWGYNPDNYPIIPGHEIVGRVINKGSEVKDHEIGDRVAVGAQILSCLEDSCPDCSEHEEPYCKDNVFTYGSVYKDGSRSQGGYARHIRAHETFAVAVPKEFDSKECAPLLCAGITVYSPLIRHEVKGKKLGVIGIGGLGHLGVKFGVALGNETVGISRTSSKKEAVESWGASHLAMDNEEQYQSMLKSFDVLLCTVTDHIVWEKYFPLLKSGGLFILVGVPDGKISFAPFGLISGRIKFVGSLIGSPNMIKQMLEFCIEKNIRPDVEVWPIEKLDEAWKNFREGKPRFRYVLDINTPEN